MGYRGSRPHPSAEKNYEQTKDFSSVWREIKRLFMKKKKKDLWRLYQQLLESRVHLLQCSREWGGQALAWLENRQLPQVKKLLALLLLLWCITMAKGQSFIEWGYGINTPYTLQWNPFSTDAGRAVVDGVNLGRNAANVGVGALNFGIKKLPNIPGIGKPDTLGLIGSWNPDSVSLRFGSSGRRSTRTLTVGRYFNGGRWGISFGKSTLNPKYPVVGADLRIYPIEIFRREQLFQFWNISRLIHLGVGAEMDFANPTLLVPRREWGFNGNLDLIGQMIQLNLFFRRVHEFSLPYLAKPTSLRERYSQWGGSIAVSLNPTRYSGEQLPPWIEVGSFVKWQKITSSDYVSDVERAKISAANAALSVSELFNKKVNELGDVIGLQIGLDENLGRLMADTVKGIRDTRFVPGYFVGLRYDERLASLGLIWEKSPKSVLRGEIGLYPLFWWGKPKKLASILQHDVFWDVSKSLELRGFVRHDWNIPSKLTTWITLGKGLGVKFPILIGRRLLITPFVLGSQVKVKNRSKARITEFQFGIKTQLTFAKRYSLDTRSNDVFDTARLDRVSPEKRDKLEKKWKEREAKQRASQKQKLSDKKAKAKEKREKKRERAQANKATQKAQKAKARKRKN